MAFLRSLFSRRSEVAAGTGSSVADYVNKSPGFVNIYNAYEPDEETIGRISAALPAAHVVVVAEYWCGDSRRQVPRMARVLERLPGWTAEVLPWNSASRGQPLRVRAIPTFVIMRGEQEIGRIVESPEHGTIEEDLLAIAGGVGDS